MDIIKLFGKNDTIFNTSNGDIILEPIKCKATKGIWANREYYLDIEVPIKYVKDFIQDRIVVVPTPWGDQAYRLGNIEKKTDRLVSKAYHVSYDSEEYIIEDAYPQEKTANAALQWVIGRTDETTPFTAESDIVSTNSSRYIRKSLFYAFCDIANVWGGIIEADNYHIKCSAELGEDKGAIFRYGVNIQTIRAKENWSDVVTKLYPTGYDGVTLEPLISPIQYEKKYTKVVEFYPGADVDTQDEQSIKTDLEQQAKEYMNVNCYPKVSYTVKVYVENATNVYDKIKLIHEPLNINMDTQVMQITYNVMTKKIESTTFGNYNESIKNIFSEITAQMQKNEELAVQRYNALNQAMEESKALINNYLYKGHKHETESATYYLNTPNLQDATKFLIISLGGIGFGEKEKGADITTAKYSTLWDIEGNFNGQCIASNSIKANSIDTVDLFAKNIMATGTITGAKLYGTYAEITQGGRIGGFAITDGNIEITNDAYINPTYDNWDMVSKYNTGSGTLTEVQKAASDLNGDGKINVADALIIRKLVTGEWDIDTVQDKYGISPKLSDVLFNINSKDATKTIMFSGKNPWGTEIETYLGINGLKTTNVKAEGIRGGIIETEAGADLDEINSNLEYHAGDTLSKTVMLHGIMNAFGEQLAMMVDLDKPIGSDVKSVEIQSWKAEWFRGDGVSYNNALFSTPVVSWTSVNSVTIGFTVKKGTMNPMSYCSFYGNITMKFK